MIRRLSRAVFESSARVTRADLAGSRREGWWGQPITVSSEQIVER